MTKDNINRDMNPASITEIFLLFIKIGSTAFGGFMALISVVQDLVVDRKKWIDPGDMLDAISVATMLPGPVAVNIVAYVGYRVRGIAGAITAATAVILPSFILILCLSVLYFKWGSIPVVENFFIGMVPAVVAIVLVTAWRLSRQAVDGVLSVVILASAALAMLFFNSFLVTVSIIALSAISGMLVYGPVNYPWDKSGKKSKKEKSEGDTEKSRTVSRSLPGINPVPVAFLVLVPSVLGKLFLVFSGMSLMLFGGGYVFIPVIQQVVVNQYAWVTQKEFIDAIAMGQVTPGPILISAAFIGYKVAGIAGALVSTIGIFTPPAIVMIVASSIMEKIKANQWVAAATRSIRAAVVGMIFTAAVVIAKSAVVEWASVLIFLSVLVAMARFRQQAAWLIPVSGIAGAVLY